MPASTLEKPSRKAGPRDGSKDNGTRGTAYIGPKEDYIESVTKNATRLYELFPKELWPRTSRDGRQVSRSSQIYDRGVLAGKVTEGTSSHLIFANIRTVAKYQEGSDLQFRKANEVFKPTTENWGSVTWEPWCQILAFQFDELDRAELHGWLRRVAMFSRVVLVRAGSIPADKIVSFNGLAAGGTLEEIIGIVIEHNQLQKAPANNRDTVPDPCSECRRAKRRCDRALPICGRCLQTGRSERCTYRTPLSKDSSGSEIVVEDPVSPNESLLLDLPDGEISSSERDIPPPNIATDSLRSSHKRNIETTEPSDPAPSKKLRTERGAQVQPKDIRPQQVPDKRRQASPIPEDSQRPVPATQGASTTDTSIPLVSDFLEKYAGSKTLRDQQVEELQKDNSRLREKVHSLERQLQDETKEFKEQFVGMSLEMDELQEMRQQEQDNNGKALELAKKDQENTRRELQGWKKKVQEKKRELLAKDAEKERISAEHERELLAKDAEKERISAELDRISAEKERISAEHDRISAENERNSAEHKREFLAKVVEKKRISAELDRISAENERISAEHDRTKRILGKLDEDYGKAIVFIEALNRTEHGMEATAARAEAERLYEQIINME